MSVTEVAGGAMGEWSGSLSANTPQAVLDAIDYFGHVAFTSSRMDPTRYGDQILDDARYVGVLTGRKFTQGEKDISGCGLSFWIGDSDDKGHAIEDEINLAAADFTTAVNSLLPPTVRVGVINPLTGTHTNRYKLSGRRAALNYLSELYAAEWRVRGNFYFDIGLPEQLYDPVPRCAIVRQLPGGGVDTDGTRALPGSSELDADVEDFSTRVVTVGEGNGLTVAVGTADIAPELNPYKDGLGNTLKMTRLVSEQNTSLVNADARAQLQLNRFTSPREAVSLSTTTHDIKGDLEVGAYVWVEDEESKLIDNTNELNFKGLRLRPVKLRISELAWPVEQGMGVAYRHWDGTWTDLTPYFEFESGDTTVTVNGYNRSLTTGTTPNDPISGQVTVDTTKPLTPEFLTPTITTTYNSPVSGLTRASVVLRWNVPLNEDGSIVVDGSHYEIRYRTSETSIWKRTNDELKLYDNAQLTGSYDSPVALELGDWSIARVPWGTESLLLQDLEPGIPYDFQIIAMDNAVPSNASEWSGSEIIQTRPDTTAPSTPAAPIIAASLISVQFRHLCGAAGRPGNFNLEADLNHFKLYEGSEPTFEVDKEAGTNLIGQVQANIGMIIAKTEVIRTFSVSSTEAKWYKCTAVDNYGNESNASSAVQQTAQLIDDAYISSLTVSKVLAGEVRTNWLLAAEMYTAESGQRLRMGFFGLKLYDQNNMVTLEANTSDGSVYLIGNVATGRVGRRVVVSGDNNEIEFFPENGETRYARIFSFIPSNYPDDIVIEMRSIDSDTSDWVARSYLFPDRAAMILSPQGQGGDVISAASLQVDDVGVHSYARDIIGTAPYVEGDEEIRSSVRTLRSGDVHIRTFSSAGRMNGIIDVTQDNVFAQVNAGVGVRDGGYLSLGRGNTGSSIFGKSTNTRSKYLSFEVDETILYEGGSRTVFMRLDQERIRFAMDGFAKFDVSGNGVFAEKYGSFNSSAGFRAFLIAQGGGDIFFYWGGGQLNIGSGSSFVKTFVIDHPDDPARHLVHATVEGPVAAVEYFGTVVIAEHVATAELPSYFESLTHVEGRAVFLQVQLPEFAELVPGKVGLVRGEPVGMPETPEWGRIPTAAPGPVVDGKFRIACSGVDGTIVSWIVKAVRKDVEQFDVEPVKGLSALKNVGPYTWLEG